jgi:hypothetical protein
MFFALHMRATTLVIHGPAPRNHRACSRRDRWVVRSRVVGHCFVDHYWCSRTRRSCGLCRTGGPIGLSRSPGPAGAAGATGPRGAAGANGAPGSPGANGTNGTNGTNGVDGSTDKFYLYATGSGIHYDAQPFDPLNPPPNLPLPALFNVGPVADYDPASNVYTVLETGLYQLTLQTTITVDPTGYDAVCAVKVDGAIVLFTQYTSPGALSSVTVPMQLTAGQEIYVQMLPVVAGGPGTVSAQVTLDKVD